MCESGREGRKDGGREECVRVGEKVGRTSSQGTSHETSLTNTA